MTKLIQWLTYSIIPLSIWLALIIDSGPIRSKEWHQFIVILPIILLFIFGLYAAIVVLYRVFTFNNCKSAAAELQQQIEEAKKDLCSKGIIF